MLTPCSHHHRRHLTILIAIPCTFESQEVSPFWQICLCLPFLCRMKFQGLPMITKVARGMQPSYSSDTIACSSTCLAGRRVLCCSLSTPLAFLPYCLDTQFPLPETLFPGRSTQLALSSLLQLCVHIFPRPSLTTLVHLCLVPQPNFKIFSVLPSHVPIYDQMHYRALAVYGWSPPFKIESAQETGTFLPHLIGVVHWCIPRT